MAQPIQVAVVFDARNRAVLQRGAEDLDRIAAKVDSLSRRAGTSGRVLRMLEQDINRFGSSLRNRVGPAINVFNTQFERMHSLALRFTRFGFYAFVGQLTVVGLTVKKLARDFIDVNQRFGELEITLKSVYGSVRTARALRDEIARITIQSPLKFVDIANTVRAFSAMPSISARIAQQAYQPGGFKQQGGFTQRAIETVEQLTTFRPDKLAEDAVFAMREAITGELRSLVRRFEFPPSLLVTASGKSIEELKRRPEEMLEAIKKAMDNIISPQAVREMARQPSKLFGNLMEQLKEIPLLKIGRYGEDAGNSFYERFLDYFYNALQRSGNFINKKFEPLAARMSAALNKMFDTIFMSDSSIVERILELAGLGSKDLPGLTSLERAYEGFTRMVESAAEHLPTAVVWMEKAATTLFPILRDLAKMFTEIAKVLVNLFQANPLLGIAGTYGALAAPSIVRGITGGIAETGIRKAEQGRLAFTSNFVNSATMANPANMRAQLAANNMGLNAAGQMYHTSGGARIGALGQTYNARSGGIVGSMQVPAVIAQAIGLNPNAMLSQHGMRTDSRGRVIWADRAAAAAAGGHYGRPVRSNLIPNLGLNSAVNTALQTPQTFSGNYTSMRNAASAHLAGNLNPFNPVVSRAAGATGAAALRLGATPAAAASMAAGVMSVGAMASSVIAPLLIAVVGTYAFTAILEKVSGWMERKAAEDAMQDLNERGISESSVGKARKALNTEGKFFSDFVSTVKNEETQDKFTFQDLGKKAIKDLMFEKTKQRVAVPTGGSMVVEQFGVGERDATVGANALFQRRKAAVNDLEKLYASVSQASFGGGIPETFLESDRSPEKHKFVNKDDALLAITSINKWLADTTPIMVSFMELGEKMSGTKYGEGLSPQQQEEFDRLTKQFTNVNSVSGLIEAFPDFQAMAEKMVAFKNTPGLENIIESMEAVTSELQNKANPFTLLNETLTEETERLEILLDLGQQINQRIAFGSFEQAGEDVTERMRSIRDKIANIAPDKRNPEINKMLATLDESLSTGQFSKLSSQAAEQLKTMNSGQQATLVFNRLGPALATIQQMFSEVGNMSDSSIERGRIQVAEAVEGLQTQLLKTGNGAIANALATSMDSLKNLPSVSGNLTAEEEANIRMVRVSILESFFSGILKSLEGAAPESESTRKLVAASQMYFKAMIGEEGNRGKDAVDTERLSRKGEFATLITQSPVEGDGFAARQLREQRMKELKRLAKFDPESTLDESFTASRYLDPTGMRGAENRLTQAKAAEATFTKLADRQEVYVRNKLYSNEEERKSAQALIELYYEQANAQRLLIEQMEGKGDAVKSFAHGVGSVLSEWRVQMQNFTDMGLQMTQNFASGISTALTQVIMKSKDAKEAFRDFALSFIEMAVQMMMQKAVTMLLGAAFGGPAGAIIGQTAGSAFQGGTGYIPNGGSALMGRSKGGPISGPPSRKDNVVIRAATGEYMIPASTVSKLGSRHFDQYLEHNFTSKEKIRGYATGGPVGDTFPSPMRRNKSAQNDNSINVPVKVEVTVNNSTGQITTKEQANQQGESMQRAITMAVKQVLIDQHRQGGIFRR